MNGACDGNGIVDDRQQPGLPAAGSNTTSAEVSTAADDNGAASRGTATSATNQRAVSRESDTGSRTEPTRTRDPAAGVHDDFRSTDDDPGLGTSREAQAHAPEPDQPFGSRQAVPVTPEELVRQRWLGMDWPKVSASDVGLSTDPGTLEIVRHTGPDLHAVTAGAARHWVESAGGSSTVVLVSGDSWQEVASAVSLAIRVNAPMLLTPAEGLGAEALSLLESTHVERALIVGDLGGAVSASLSVLGELGVAIERVAGEDVYATSAAAGRVPGAGYGSSALANTAIVVSAGSPTGAIAAVSPSGQGMPVLFTPPEELHPSTAEFIVANAISRVLLIGSATEFSPGVAQSIEAAGAEVVLLTGETPHDVETSVARHFEETNGREPHCTTSPTTFVVGLADDPHTALVAAPLLAHLCAPLLHVDGDQLSPKARNDIYLARHRQGGAQVHVFANTEDLPDSIVDIRQPPIRLAFPVDDPAVQGLNDTMAVIDEQRHVKLYLQGEGFTGINWLAWSPNAPRLAFAATHDGVDGLFLLEADTGSARRLTPPDRTLRLSTWAPAQWSPTGTHIAMSAYDDPTGNYHDRDADLYLVNADSGAFTVLAESDEHDQFIQWNPAGDRILFLRHDQFGLPLGWMPERDRVFLADISDRSVSALDLKGQALWHAQWSPDSSMIAMALIDDDASHSGDPGTPRIRLVASDPSPVASAGDDLTDGYILGWSADGSMLGVSQVLSDGDNYQSRIAIVDAADRQLTELAEPPDLTPHEHLRFWSWAPHQNAVLFDRYNTDTRNTGSLLLIDAEGQSLLQLPGPIAQAEYRPFGFSPDGSQTGSTVYSDVWLIIATDTRSDGSERLLLDVTEYRGLRTEQWADIQFFWNQYGLSGTIEWYADY